MINMFQDGSSGSSDSDSAEESYFLEPEATEEEPEVFPSHSQAAVTNMDADVGPYSEEPIADEEWLSEYKKTMEKAETLFEEYSKRLNGEIPLESWCQCGQCKITNLTNPSECQCCKEIEGCINALNSDLVLKEVEAPPNCITSHPGFTQVCLARWSLRLSGRKYRTMAKKTYQIVDSEERFFRAVSYREFTQLVHGYLGKRRLPLPACAYDLIRTEFPSAEKKGYEDEPN